MTKNSPLRGIILAIVDERGPHPQLWYPESFANLAQIHNSAVKSFSIMIGDRSYREKSLFDMTCFGILPFPDINSVGFIHFFGVENINPEKKTNQLPTTITLFFEDAFRDELCRHSPEIHQFLERESKILWETAQGKASGSSVLSQLFQKMIEFLNNLD